MSENEVLHAKVRTETGKRRNRRLRRSGQIPAVLYGHGEPVVSIAVPAEEVDAMMRHGSRVVTLQGDVKANAFVREVQWDAFGREVLHLDFNRVTAREKVEVAVAIEIKGDAAGVRAGGLLEVVTHEIQILCPVMNIPESIVVDVSELNIGDSILAEQLALPENAELLSDPNVTIVHIVEPREEEEEEAGVGAEGVEPEVIGQKEEESESEG